MSPVIIDYHPGTRAYPWTVRLNKAQVRAALVFSRERLGIKGHPEDAFEIRLPYIWEPQVNATCWHTPLRLEFVRSPYLNWVFHEVTHWWQSERDGKDAMLPHYRRVFGIGDFNQAFREYHAIPYEVEAREVAARLVREYMEFKGTPMPNWTHPDLWEGS